jgi:inhibitor of cysteine peptidase
MKKALNKYPKHVKIVSALFLICAVILSGCIEQEQNNTDNESVNNTTSGQGDNEEEYTYGTATVENIQIMTLESFPVQIHVLAEGYLPDGCTEVYTITTEREGNTFNVNISTKRPKDAICTQEIVPFNETISLEVQGLKAGNYTVNVNGVTGSFELAVDNTLVDNTLNDSPNAMPPKQKVVTEENNGTTINLENEETFYLRLKENPTTGYSWQLNLSEGLSLISDEYIPPESKESKQPLVGAGGVRLWEIKAVSEGSQQITGIYKQSWENKTGKEDNFTLNIEVA